MDQNYRVHDVCLYNKKSTFLRTTTKSVLASLVFEVWLACLTMVIFIIIPTKNATEPKLVGLGLGPSGLIYDVDF